jgi:Uncharacterised nucleotidyltransferase
MPNVRECMKQTIPRMISQPVHSLWLDRSTFEKGMSTEPAFLIAALRYALNVEATLPDPRNIDWTVLLRLADAHAVLPMLDSAVRNVSMRDDIAQEMRAAIEKSVGWSLAQSAELARLGDLFNKHEIPFIAVKGPLLSRYLYGDLSVRSSGDIDLFVKREDVLQICHILGSNGHRMSSTLHWNSASACLHSRESEMSFVSPSGVSIDVHWRLVPSYFASAFDKLDVWKCVMTATLAGRSIRVLAPEPLLLFLCAHGAKHMFERLAWICDIGRFLTVTPDLNWDAVIRRAERAHSLRQLWLGLELATDLLGTPAPPVLRHDPVVKTLLSAVRRRLLAGARPPAGAIESNAFCLRLLERPTHRLRYLAGLYLTPSEAEYRALRLPGSLYVLYYPYRPIRLFWKHAIRRSVRTW